MDNFKIKSKNSENMAYGKKEKVEAHENERSILRSSFFNYFTWPLVAIEIFEKCDILSLSYHLFSQNEIDVVIK